LLSLAFCIVDLTENIWDAISEIHLNFTEDLHQSKFESSGIFSTRSAYRSFFIGAIHFEPWKRLWKAWAPNKCKIFVWIVIHNRCWTADHLQRRGLPHPDHCPLCDQEDETAQHILTSCVYARQFWFSIPQPLNLSGLIPTQHPLRSGGESPGGKCQSSIRKVSTPLLYWEHGSSGNTESPVCLMDLLQIFGLPYRASKMNPT